MGTGRLLKSYFFTAVFSITGSLLSWQGMAAEDCVGLNYRNAEVKKIGTTWKIVEGSHWAFDFGDKEVEAKKALEVIKANRIMKSCFVGRPGPSFKYLLSVGDQAPSVNLLNEDCIPFNNDKVTIMRAGPQNSWKMVEGNMWMVDFGNTATSATEARQALSIVKKYKFNRQCFIGRPDPSFEYWKKS